MRQFYVVGSGSYDVVIDGGTVFSCAAIAPVAPTARSVAHRPSASSSWICTHAKKPTPRASRRSYAMEDEGDAHPSFGELALLYSKPRAASVVCAKAKLMHLPLLRPSLPSICLAVPSPIPP